MTEDEAQDRDSTSPAGSSPFVVAKPRFLRIVGLSVGLLLVAGAIAFVAINADDVREAIASLARPSWWRIACLILAVIANVALTGLLYSVLMSRYGRVELGEMQALIAAATLLNFLPFRPGLPGRIAYHKAVNRIAVKDSARVVISAVAISAIVGGIIAGFVALDVAGGPRVSRLFAACVALTAIGLVVRPARRWAAAILLREFDVLVWAVRYMLVFGLVGRAIDFDTAMALACISMFAPMIPFLSNGLGLREWAIGLATPLLAVAVDSPLAVAADLVNRAAEMVTVGVIGSLAILYLARRRRRNLPPSPTASTTTQSSAPSGPRP